MTQAQAIRFGHRWMAIALQRALETSIEHWKAWQDGEKVQASVRHWIESHARRGPLSTDVPPAGLAYVGEPLPFEERQQ